MLRSLPTYLLMAGLGVVLLSFAGDRSVHGDPTLPRVFLSSVLNQLSSGAATGATSLDLIAQAQSAGRITAEQAAVLRVQALVGDPALPAEYRGAQPSGVSGTLIMSDIAA